MKLTLHVPTAPVTKQEAKLVEESGVNGYGIATDKDEIEDQLIHFYNFKDVNANSKSGAYLKVRGAAAKKLDGSVSDAGDGLLGSFGDASK